MKIEISVGMTKSLSARVGADGYTVLGFKDSVNSAGSVLHDFCTAGL